MTCNDECSAASVSSKKSQIDQKMYDMAACSADLTCWNEGHGNAALSSSNLMQERSSIAMIAKKIIYGYKKCNSNSLPPSFAV